MTYKAWLLAAAVGLAGCGGGESKTPSGGVGVEEESGTTKQDEAWSSGDSPALFSSSLEFELDKLPAEGEAAAIPWAGNYWPTYEDNINKRWAGPSTSSPAKKYEQAFHAQADGGSAMNVEDLVSKYHGIESATRQKECAETPECKSELGEVCAKREDMAKGRCLPTWWGICHAWAPASILIPEPKRPVVRNGVEFKVQDIKALATLVHNKTTTRFVSLRCNKSLGESEVAFDNYGRPSDANKECRDTNPGTWHVLLGNYLGLMKQSFVEDRTIDHEVWNQPLRGYRVKEQREVTLAEANTLIGATSVGGETQELKDTLAKGVWSHHGPFPVTAGKPVVVRMTGTGDADLFVRFGEKPLASAYDCRPYEGGSTETCELTAPEGATQVYVSAVGYAESSDFVLKLTLGGEAPEHYVFNPNAKRFVFIRAEVDYISESNAGTDGNLQSQIDRYTRTDHYEYVLELDDGGRIVGGEWVGASKSSHPDFVWLPTSHSGTSVAGGAITFAKVKELLDESTRDETPGSGSEKKVQTAGTVKRGELKLQGPYKVAAGAQLVADLTGTADADLYVRKGANPTARLFDCRPYKTGSTERCTLDGPADVYVGVMGYAATSDFQLTVTYREP